MIQFRKRRIPFLPLTLSALLMGLNIALMVCWIVLLSSVSWWGSMTVGTVAFALILLGLSFYLFLSIKERQLNHRQATFIDSVTHELKSPIASLRLYLETLRYRKMSDEQRDEFYGTMNTELKRLNALISQLLEVARLDAVGQGHAAEDVAIEPLLRKCAETACLLHGQTEDAVFEFDVQPAVIPASRMVLEMIFGNVLDNAVKYGGRPPRVQVQVRLNPRGRVVTRVSDNGPGVPAEIQNSIFRLFFRGGDELQRRQKGTGLGLYIAYALVRKHKGKLTVREPEDAAAGAESTGAVFEVELPGKAAEPCAS